MKKTNKAKLHTTDFLDDFLSGISEKEQQETTARMKIAAAIDDAMKARNISKTELAKRTKQNNCVITKWLSGTQNFTTDTLEQIGKVLEINLLHNYDAKSVTMEKKVIRKTQIPVKRSYAAVNINSYKRIAQYSFAY